MPLSSNHATETSGLRAVLLCEFDAVQGAKLAYAASSPEFPPNGDAGEYWRAVFASVSDYLLPRPRFCRSHVTVLASSPCGNSHLVVGHPVLLEHDKYPRNTALWNVAFVIPADTDTTPWVRIATKLARTLRLLELESEYVTSLSNRSALCALLMRVQLDLNRWGETSLLVNERTAIDLKLRLPLAQALDPPPVVPWDVPICVTDCSRIDSAEWDVTLLRLLPLIDGVRSVHTIAAIADLDCSLVGEAVRHLVYFGVAKIIDLFQSTNMYATTSKLRQLAFDEQIQASCISYVSKQVQQNLPQQPNFSSGAMDSFSGNDNEVEREKESSGREFQLQQTQLTVTSQQPEQQRATPAVLMALYAQLGQPQGMGGGNFCSAYATVAEFAASARFTAYSIDIRRFVVFGVLQGWLRRVHQYPQATAAWQRAALESRSPTSVSMPADRTLPVDYYAVRQRTPSAEIVSACHELGIPLLPK